MIRIALFAIAAIVAIIIGYIAWSGLTTCSKIVDDPFDDCETQITINYPCDKGPAQINHFVTSGNLKLGGNSNENNLNATNDQVFDLELECYRGSLGDKTVDLIGDFYITVPCDKIPDNVLNNNITFGGDQISAVSIISKIFKGNDTLPDVDIEFSLVKGHQILRQLSSPFDITFNDYDFLCINGEPKCAAVIRMKLGYTMKNIQAQLNEKYKLVFYAQDHHAGMTQHEIIQIVQKGCYVPRDVFYSKEMQTAHQGFFKPEEIKKALQDQNEANRMEIAEIPTDSIVVQESLLGNKVAQCFYNYQENDLRFYTCLEESGCHIANHLVIIDLPDICPGHMSLPSDWVPPHN